jgi:hypothetical protein
MKYFILKLLFYFDLIDSYKYVNAAIGDTVSLRLSKADHSWRFAFDKLRLTADTSSG